MFAGMDMPSRASIITDIEQAVRRTSCAHSSSILIITHEMLGDVTRLDYDSLLDVKIPSMLRWVYRVTEFVAALIFFLGSFRPAYRALRWSLGLVGDVQTFTELWPSIRSAALYVYSCAPVWLDPLLMMTGIGLFLFSRTANKETRTDNGAHGWLLPHQWFATFHVEIANISVRFAHLFAGHGYIEFIIDLITRQQSLVLERIAMGYIYYQRVEWEGGEHDERGPLVKLLTTPQVHTSDDDTKPIYISSNSGCMLILRQHVSLQDYGTMIAALGRPSGPKKTWIDFYFHDLTINVSPSGKTDRDRLPLWRGVACGREISCDRLMFGPDVAASSKQSDVETRHT